jgi:choline dehydrogenase-like flavoprotein
MNDPVDVLIIGAGASGAAVAWSLADTKMHIVCLEQGGWMNPATYPSTGRDWEARYFGDFSTSPNIRARPEDYPINDDSSPHQGRLAPPIGSRLFRALLKAFSGNTRHQKSATGYLGASRHAGATVLQREVERRSIRDQPGATAMLHGLSNIIAGVIK